MLNKISKDNDFSLSEDDFFNRDMNSEMEIQFHTYIENPEEYHVNVEYWVND